MLMHFSKIVGELYHVFLTQEPEKKDIWFLQGKWLFQFDRKIRQLLRMSELNFYSPKFLQAFLSYITKKFNIWGLKF